MGRGLPLLAAPDDPRVAEHHRFGEAPVSECYEGKHRVGINVHRRRSVLVRMSEAGRSSRPSGSPRIRTGCARSRTAPARTRRWSSKRVTAGPGPRTPSPSSAPRCIWAPKTIGDLATAVAAAGLPQGLRAPRPPALLRHRPDLRRNQRQDVLLTICHTTPTITLNTYAGYWPDAIDQTRMLVDDGLGGTGPVRGPLVRRYPCLPGRSSR